MRNRVLHIATSGFVLMATWLIWSGHFDSLMITYGVLSVVAVIALSLHLGVLDDEGQPYRLAVRMALYIPWIVWEVVKANADDEYLQNKYQEQLGYMGTIKQDLSDLVRAFIPFYPREVASLDMVAKVSNELFQYVPTFWEEL